MMNANRWKRCRGCCSGRDFHREAAFATGGKSALDLLAEKPFDVIISDIRMPEMDGAALLKIACERFPGVVRIVVCSQEEMNGALRAVPVAHQFLLKPCEPHMLRVAVVSASSLRTSSATSCSPTW